MSLGAQELKEIRKLARDFARKELAPVVERSEASETFALDVFRKLTETKLHVLNLPEEYGGAESLYGLTIVAEELSRVDPGFVLSVMASSQLFGYNVLRMGTPAQKDRYLRGIADEAKIGCWALTEPDTGSDAVGIRTRAVKDGDSYRLTGSKTFITNAPIADYFIVLAREEGAGIEGGTAFVLERGDAGMELSTPLKKMGHRTSPTGQIFLNDCRVPLSRVLGQPGRAFFDMKHSLDLERLGFMGIGMGLMKECFDRAVAYSATRKQFGKPIAEFQLVQEHIADMACKIELLQAYMERGFALHAAGKPVLYEAAILKTVGAEWCVQVADRAVQVLGGNGYMREYAVEKLLRDARLFPIGGGTSEINKLIVAREVFKRAGRQGA